MRSVGSHSTSERENEGLYEMKFRSLYLYGNNSFVSVSVKASSPLPPQVSGFQAKSEQW